MILLFYSVIGFKMAIATCISLQNHNTVDEGKCDLDKKPTKTILPCNTHPCSTKYVKPNFHFLLTV